MRRHTDHAKARRWLLLLSIIPAGALYGHSLRSQDARAAAADAAGAAPAGAPPVTTAATTPDTATLNRAEALASRAVIRRDKYGVPHILAETEEAAAFAHGYVTAEDHGAELARLFLRARGALASVFGEAFV